MTTKDSKTADDSSSVALCASCDRCRARKTKCDGKRPCSNCAQKYMKKQKVNSIEGVDLEEFECVYSPAKRRGPIPGKSSSSSSGTTRKAGEMNQQPQPPQQQQQPQPNADWQQMAALGAQSAAALFNSQGLASAAAQGVPPTMDPNLRQQLSFLQQLQQQQAEAQPLQEEAPVPAEVEEPSARRVKMSDQSQQQQGGIPRTITQHTHLLERSDAEGVRLLAYYKLSIDELFRLTPTPTDEEYCTRLNMPGMTPSMIPGSHLAALSAARFAEVALGAVVHNEVSLAMELCNAVVHCLRESVQEPVQTPVMFEVAKAYFLLGVFRACRGDMVRYFKYRRVCMTYLAKLEDDASTASLMAAVSFLDSWAYMIYNADEKALPKVDDIPPVGPCLQQSPFTTETERKFKVKTDPGSVASDPKNQNWIQGAPPVYLNNEAPLNARALDALACAVRTCCDQANCRFAAIQKDANPEDGEEIPQDSITTPTTSVVMSHEDELCSRNMVLSAYTLMQQYESANKGKHKNEGQHLIISAMDAFLENSDDDGNGGGFTDSQIQSLLSVCNTAVENPFLLHHAGPTYHMVSNAAVLLSHLLNGMYAMKANGHFGRMEATMFEEVLDTFISIRKLLTIHRRKLPVKLRCHCIPRPSLEGPEEGQPFIDLGETILCSCRGCQGFVLMACSPCVAAERARKASHLMEVEAAKESEAVELGELDKELDDLGAEFDLDDDALLGMISSLISN